MKRIALAGNLDIALKTHVLTVANMTGLPFILPKSKFEIASQLNLNDKVVDMSQLITYSTERTIHRLQKEKLLTESGFITEGSILDDLVRFETIWRVKNTSNVVDVPDWMDNIVACKLYPSFLNSFRRIISDYMKDRYDIIIFIPRQHDKEEETLESIHQDIYMSYLKEMMNGKVKLISEQQIVESSSEIIENELHLNLQRDADKSKELAELQMNLSW